MITLMTRMVIYINNPEINEVNDSHGPRGTGSKLLYGSEYNVSSSMLLLAPGLQVNVNSKANQSFQIFHHIVGSLTVKTSAHQ